MFCSFVDTLFLVLYELMLDCVVSILSTVVYYIKDVKVFIWLLDYLLLFAIN
jgi:hypothetical protein